MKILHVLNDIQEIGNGIVNVAIDLACLQARDGYEVAVASLGGEYEALLARYNVHHFFIDQSRTPLKLFKAVKRYRAIVQEFQPDIVHVHMMTGAILSKILRGSSQYLVVSTVHNEFQRSAIFMGLADRVIAVSEAVSQSMKQRGIAQAKLRVVQNGTLGSPRTRPAIDYSPAPLKQPAIVTVAGLFQRKGIAELIEAFDIVASQFLDVNLYLVGNGDDRSMFEMQAHQTKVATRIHFEGFQPKPQCYLKSADIFVLASRKDPSPLVISEAREVGCAIIATEVDGIPEALDLGKAGILVPSQNSYALAEALTLLLSNYNLLQHWKNRAQENLERLSVDRVNRETLAVYFELLQSHKKINSSQDLATDSEL